MKHLLLLLLIIVLPAWAFSQSWQTVKRTDTNYFSAGQLSTNYDQHPRIDSDFIRFIWVDSAKASGADSVFYFFRSARRTGPNFTADCIDTLAPTWTGTKMIRKPGGIEYYFNSVGDTLTFLTQAPVGTTWTIGKDGLGKTYKGTIASASMATIDGSTDSVKTITIQAYQGSTAIADWYNSFVFQISKNHGWIKTLDLYRFPNKLNPDNRDLFGGLVDSTQHVRLPRSYMQWDLTYVDLAVKYAAGNEFITEERLGIYPSYGGGQRVQFDSVISATMISPNSVSVVIKTDKYYNIWLIQTVPVNSVGTQTYIHTDTIISVPTGLPLVTFLNGEARVSNAGVRLAGLNPYLRGYADTLCGKPAVQISFVSGYLQQANSSSSCLLIGYGVSGYQYEYSTYLKDFGVIKHTEDQSEYWGQAENYVKREIVYAKMPNCTWGTKFNVLKLGVNDMAEPAQSFTIFPNPANGSITIAPRYHFAGSGRVVLYNVAGMVISEQVVTENGTIIPTSNLAQGLYFIEVNKDGIRQRVKVVVQH